MALDLSRRLDGLPTPTVRAVAWAAGGMFAGLSVPMQGWERRMRATGGPGIVGLQLARDPEQAMGVLAAWGPAGRQVARLQTWVDFGYLKTYGFTGVCAAELLRRRSSEGSGWERTGHVVRWLPAVAATCDAIENVLLLQTLSSPAGVAPSRGRVRATRAAATMKFGLLGGTLLWAAAAAVAEARSARR